MHVWKIKLRSLKIEHIMGGSFSSVSTPIFAAEYFLKEPLEDIYPIYFSKAFCIFQSQKFSTRSSK